jgi:hypothetical protein
MDFTGRPTSYVGLVTVTGAARALNLADENYFHGLCRADALVATEVGRVWNIDPDSVELRRLRLERKRSSAVHRQTNASGVGPKRLRGMTREPGARAARTGSWST